ncbi:hypothetical protein [Streptomyces sp. NPDC088762]|uniref:hypothetical protein n=1 Tax=Streptomyces sp. NPDC088762 TaxID=3365891 RepID=UPI00381CC85C
MTAAGGGSGRGGRFATLTRGRAARVGRALGGPGRPVRQGRAQAARMPFVLLVVALLAGGLISLLLLNSALNEGSFRLSKLKKETTALTDEEQALQRDVDGYSAPDALQRRAQELGLVPGGSPVFIGPDGKITGAAAPAEPPAPPSPPPSAAATPSAQPSAEPSAQPSAATSQPSPSPSVPSQSTAAPGPTPQPNQPPGR